MAYYNLGNTLHDLGKYREAIDEFEAAIRIEPELIHAHFNLGIAYQGMKDLRNALRCYERASELDPSFEEAQQACEYVRGKMRQQEQGGGGGGKGK
mmetsp:Transcript_6227/g.10149  ORF Transcript_6227/g.10149 Transcript_6227/m.10149 type:complete len:96 (+) Transcript_6227:337-624(+)